LAKKKSSRTKIRSWFNNILESRLPFRRAKYGQVDVSLGSYYYKRGKEWKAPEDRIAVYEKAWSYYLENQFARPIINLTASATFGKGIQFVGNNDQVQFARKLIKQLDLFQVGIESGIYGDNFIRIFHDKNDINHFEIALLPPKTIGKVVDEDNVNEVKWFVQQFPQVADDTNPQGEEIPPEEMVHVMVNAVSDSLFGNSDLYHLFYHLDMYDSLVEEADKRRLFASQPIGKFIGIDLRYRVLLKKRMAKLSRDVDTKKGIRRSFPPGTQLYLPKGADYQLVEPTGKFDLEAMINRLAKVIAMASETPTHWLNLGEMVNRATAREMLFPFMKKIQRRQSIFARKFEELFYKIYKISLEKSGGKNIWPWKTDENKEGKFDLKVVFPPIQDYELSEIEKISRSILSVRAAGIISAKTALDLICQYFGLDVEKEEEKLSKEQEESVKETEESFSKVDLAIAEIGNAVAKGEIEKEVATKLITKILNKAKE